MFVAAAVSGCASSGGSIEDAVAPIAPTTEKYAAIVVDTKTGKMLYGANVNELRYPASLTKMMTLYMLFEAMDEGRVSRNDLIPISKNAAARPPSKLGLKPGQSIPVDTAIRVLVVKSANDVATAVAEFLGGGSEARFAQMMTAKARTLGMKRTVFKNASGLPDSDQVTTATDMAILSIALILTPRLVLFVIGELGGSARLLSLVALSLFTLGNQPLRQSHLTFAKLGIGPQLLDTLRRTNLGNALLLHSQLVG